MLKFLIALSLVTAVIWGGLFLAFRRGRRLAMPSQDVIERVKARERALEKQERMEREN